jgi:hypothetical protein
MGSSPRASGAGTNGQSVSSLANGVNFPDSGSGSLMAPLNKNHPMRKKLEPIHFF